MFYSLAIFVACEQSHLCEFGENFGGEAAITPTCIGVPSHRLLSLVSFKSSVFHPLLIRIDYQSGASPLQTYARKKCFSTATFYCL